MRNLSVSMRPGYFSALRLICARVIRSVREISVCGSSWMSWDWLYVSLTHVEYPTIDRPPPGGKR
jgi:hypothetical protein